MAALAGAASTDVALCLEATDNTNTPDCLDALPCLAQGLTVIEDTGYTSDGVTSGSLILNYGTVQFLPVAPTDASGTSCDAWTFQYGEARWVGRNALANCPEGRRRLYFSCMRTAAVFSLPACARP